MEMQNNFFLPGFSFGIWDTLINWHTHVFSKSIGNQELQELKKHRKMNDSMAKPIELGLELKGEDAENFHRYIKNPSIYDTPDGKRIIREAVALDLSIIRR